MNDAQILERAKNYCNVEQNETFAHEVAQLIEENNMDELRERFYRLLDFGTGGLRGIIGGGSNRMNTYTIRLATQGLATYIKKAVPDRTPSIAIAHDSRNYSDTFALETALVMCANGIKSYLYSGLRPTPQLSFTVRHLHTDAGVVITASHNPKQYNGYKVYWNDGGQIITPHDKAIIEEVKATKDSDITVISKEQALEQGLLQYIDTKEDEAYISDVVSKVLRRPIFEKHANELSVVYTPLHGSGMAPLGKALQTLGIDVQYVPEQKEPDGNFPTVEYPNPEETSAMQMALNLAREKKSDIVLGTDPDADRLGIAIRHKDQYHLITGNQLGALLADYIFTTREEQENLPPNPVLIKTIVTSELQRLIANKHNSTCVDVLTGFKYIAAKIKEFEESHEEEPPHYIFGGEESYGYLVGTSVRDKDAVSAAVITVEMTLYHQLAGKTLIDRLEELWNEFGYFEEKLTSHYFEGMSGIETMKGLMESLRAHPPETMGGEKVHLVKDYLAGTTKDLFSGTSETNIDLPQSNVLQFILESGAVVTARPSGTEPKIKYYASCCSTPGTALAEAKKTIASKIDVIMKELVQ